MSSPFVPGKKAKVGSKKFVAGCEYLVTNRKIVPIFKDSGDVIDGQPVGSIVPKVVEEKVDINSYVNSFKDEVGVANVIKRFMRTGDMSLFAQQQVIENVDVTKMPTATIEELYNSLPDDLKGDKTFEEFVKGLTAEQLNAWVSSQIKQSEVKESQEGGQE